MSIQNPTSFKVQTAGEPDTYKTVITFAAGVEDTRTGDIPATTISGVVLSVTADDQNPGYVTLSGENGVMGILSPAGSFSLENFAQKLSLAVKDAQQPDGDYIVYTSVSPKV